MNATEIKTTVTIKLPLGDILALVLGELTTNVGDLFWNGASICKADHITVGQYRRIIDIY